MYGIEVFLPGAPDWFEPMEAGSAHQRAMAAELAALQTVRADLLSALLSQEIAVDAAVDMFVKAA